MSRIRLVLADDHVPFRAAAAALLDAAGDLEVVGLAGDAATAASLAAELQPDILLLDVDMPGGGAAAAAAATAACPGAVVAMLTASTAPDDLSACLTAGARGYILKGLPASELAAILRLLHAGRSYVSPAVAHLLTPELARLLDRPPANGGD